MKTLAGAEMLGVHYVYDENYGEHRLSAKAGEATEDNPLKIYYRLAPHTITYEYDTSAPADAEPPGTGSYILYRRSDCSQSHDCRLHLRRLDG